MYTNKSVQTTIWRIVLAFPVYKQIDFILKRVVIDLGTDFEHVDRKKIEKFE